MKAAVVGRRDGRFPVLDLEIADPIGDEVLVAVRASGLCHSDILNATHDLGFPLPMVCGHEVAGEVLAVGPGVGRVRVGDRVTTCVAGRCGRCGPCRRGRPWLCADKASLRRPDGAEPRLSLDGQPVFALGTIGGFAEQVLVPEGSVVTIDPGVPFESAAVLGCAVVTGLGAALNAARIAPGDAVAVVGCGGVGLNVIQGAVLAGAGRIVGLDVRAANLELAQAFGATDVVDVSSTPVVDGLRAVLPAGVDHAFEAVGSAATIEAAAAVLDRGGTAYLIGVTGTRTELSFVDAFELAINHRAVQGVYTGATNLTRDIPRYVDLYLDGKLKLDELVGRRIGLDGIEAAYADESTGRTVVVS